MTIGIISMVAFNLTDTFFVSRLGTNHLAALSFTLPVVLVLTRFALGLGVGSASVVSRAIGMGDWNEVRRLTTDGLGLAIAFVFIFTLAGFLTMDRIFGMLGAEGEIMSLIRQYMRIWYLGMIFVVVPMVGNNAIRATGDTKTPMMIMLIAVAVNMTLDPLLIFGIGPFPRMGLAGAATATVFARMTTFTVSFLILYRRLGMITFHRPHFSEMIESWKRILFIAIPAAAARVIIPLGQGVLTAIVAAYGAKKVAAIGVAFRIEFFSLAVIMALSSVLAPFVGQNWGAGLFPRVREAIKLSCRFAVIWCVGFAVLLAAGARVIAEVFSKDPEVVSGIVLYLRIVSWTFFANGVFRLVTGVLNVLNKPLHAAGLGFAQTFALTIPLAWAGGRMYGLTGLFAGIGASYIIGGVVSRFALWKQVHIVESEHKGE